MHHAPYEIPTSPAPSGSPQATARGPPGGPIRPTLALAVAGLLACTAPRTATMPVDAGPLAFSPSGDAPVQESWWATFQDDALDRHVRDALRDNFSVRAAFARVQAADAVVWRERAALVPVVSAFADSSVGTADPFEGTRRVPVEFGVRTSYEVDLFGRIRATARGEARRRDATVEDARAAALSLSADIAQTWVALGATREQLALLDAQIVANQGMAKVVEARFLNGVVRQADSLRQARLLEQTRAARVATLEDLEVLEHRLAVLLGRPPQQAISPLPDGLPDLPPLPDAGVPVELLRRRPDVRAAESRLLAADADVAVAIAEQFPRLTLRASASNAPASTSDLLQGWIADLGANLVAPLLGAGARRAEVQRRKALLEAAVSDYGDTLLRALQEVEDALARNRRQAELVANLERQVTLAEQTARGLEAQYTGGLDVGYLDVLTAQTTAQSLRRQQIDARQRHLQVRIDLYRALAGGLDPERLASADPQEVR